jgi:hypothetical protein
VTATPEIRDSESGKVRIGRGWGVSGWLLGILGGISLFLGLFVMFGNEDSSIGIGGDLSWQVSEITDAWMYGLIVGGGVAVLAALAIMLFAPRREATGASDFSDLIGHAAVFLVVNAFIWVQDIAIGGGVDYAYWVTVPWAIGLAIHALVYYSSHRPGGPRQLREPQPH